MKTAEKSVVLPVQCTDEDCGAVSAYEFYPDGSQREVLKACWHEKQMPTLQTIRSNFQ